MAKAWRMVEGAWYSKAAGIILRPLYFQRLLPRNIVPRVVSPSNHLRKYRCQTLTSCALKFFSCVLGGFDDVVISGAAAHIASDAAPYFGFRRVRISLQCLQQRHDHARSAKPALQSMLFPKRLLYGMKLVLAVQALNCLDTFAVGLDRQHGP